MDQQTPYENATGSRSIFGLEPGEGFHMVDFDDPRSGHGLAERRSGKLKCVRFAANAKIENRIDRSRAGCLGYSAYTWRVRDAADMRRRVMSAGATDVSELAPDEFGVPAFSLCAPDGYYWVLMQGER
jgi:hypothetical protein